MCRVKTGTSYNKPIGLCEFNDNGDSQIFLPEIIIIISSPESQFAKFYELIPIFYIFTV